MMLSVQFALLLLGIVSSHANAQSCNADNCARAVTGTRQGDAVFSAHMADCQSFFRYTSTPATSTVTSTVTPSTLTTTVSVTSTIVVAAANAKRQARGTVSSPSMVPSYASACSGTARYSSACMCFSGVTKTTVVAPTPTTTVLTTASSTPTFVTTVVQTVTSTSSPVAPCSTIRVKAQNPSSQYNNYYLSIDVPQENRDWRLVANSANGEIIDYILDSQGRLAPVGTTGIYIATYRTERQTSVGSRTPNYDDDPRFALLTCVRVGSSLTCTVNSANTDNPADVFNECNNSFNRVSFGPVASTCRQLTFVASDSPSCPS